jgi:hypothetical protein
MRGIEVIRIRLLRANLNFSSNSVDFAEVGALLSLTLPFPLLSLFSLGLGGHTPTQEEGKENEGGEMERR